MKNIITRAAIILTLIAAISLSAKSQVGIGTITPNASSMLDLSSTTKGFLPPRMTEAERDLIASPSAGLFIYNTTTSKLNYYNASGATWQVVTNIDGYVDKVSNESIGGDKIFTGMLTPQGRLMLPMGEISYFDYSGFSVAIPTKALGASGNDNMVKIDPTESDTYPLRVPFINNVFGTGTSSRLTYQGTVGRYFHIALSFSYTPGTTGDVFVFGVARNGTVEDASKVFIKTQGVNDHQSSAMHVLLWLEPSEYLEFFVGNTYVGSSSIKIKSLNFVAIGM